jgi:hypothetical protein
MSLTRCPIEARRLAKISPKLRDRIALERCRSDRCEALREHVTADTKELHADLRAGRCVDAAIVLDHLELIAKKG